MPNRNKIFQVEKNLGFPNNNFFIAFVVFSGCVHGNSGSNPKSIDYTVRYFYKADGSGTKTAAFFPKVHFGTKAYFESTKNELSAFLNKDAAGGAIVIEQVICTSSTLGLNIETFAEELIPRTEGMTKEAYRDKLVTSLAQIRAKDLLLDETCKDNMSPKMMAAREQPAAIATATEEITTTTAIFIGSPKLVSGAECVNQIHVNARERPGLKWYN